MTTPSWCQWEKQLDPSVYSSALHSSSFFTLGLRAAKRQFRNSCSYMLRLFDFGIWHWFYWRQKSTHEHRIKQPIPRQSCSRREEWKVQELSIIPSLIRVSIEVNDPDFFDFKWLLSESLLEARCWGRSGRISPEEFHMHRLISSESVQLDTANPCSPRALSKPLKWLLLWASGFLGCPKLGISFCD